MQDEGKQKYLWDESLLFVGLEEGVVDLGGEWVWFSYLNFVV